MKINKKIKILGIPLNLGQRRLGPELAPQTIREVGLHEAITNLNLSFIDDGDINIPSRELLIGEESESLRYMPTIAKLCLDLANYGEQAIKDDYFPVFLGGDHAMSLGTISGIAKNQRVGVVWVDAHGDFNTHETSPSNNIHGMPLASLVGLGHKDLQINKTPAIQKEDVVIIGARDLDDGEMRLLKENNIKVYSMDDIKKLGMQQIISEIEDYFKHLDKIHVSFDMDSLDPTIARGVGTPAANGLNMQDTTLLLHSLHSSGKVCSADVVELNPLLDKDNSTAMICVKVISLLLGGK